MERQVIHTVDDFNSWVKDCPTIVALDTETTSLKYLELDIIGFSLCDGKRACYVELRKNKDRQQILDVLSDYLNNKCKLCIMHNASYDLMVLTKIGAIK